MHEQISTRLSKEAKKWEEIVFEMFIFQKDKSMHKHSSTHDVTIL